MSKASYLVKRLIDIEERLRLSEQDAPVTTSDDDEGGEDDDDDSDAGAVKNGGSKIVPGSKKDFNPDGSMKPTGGRIDDIKKKMG